jgi:hypothetical protein
MQEWLTESGTSNCASCKSPPPVNTLAWLGLLAVSIHGPLQKEYTSRKEQPALTHQEGRNDVQLHGHAASWTGHSTAQRSMPLQFTVALQPSSANKRTNAKPLHHTDALVITAFQPQLITHYCTTFKAFKAYCGCFSVNNHTVSHNILSVMF